MGQMVPVPPLKPRPTHPAKSCSHAAVGQRHGVRITGHAVLLAVVGAGGRSQGVACVDVVGMDRLSPGPMPERKEAQGIRPISNKLGWQNKHHWAPKGHQGALRPRNASWYVQEVIQRGRSSVRPACMPVLNVVPAVSDLDLSESEGKSQKRPGGSAVSSQPCENIVVAYYFCGEPIPYRTLVKGRMVSLGQFKELLTKKGNYRYYFKKVSDEFDCGVVFEEVREDEAVLPIFEEKIIGKVEKID
ncbi:hypothetical protein JD844_020157 [Phrynosoma platyrhinos]|uniref:DIX domain-containing protein n=1 Tax=Phrynosoma platyrhinos TaxID=52577 RepID=A0ABQ7TQY3_PHRPL|nr:hypothetical protein JD844_020157 [Phrynosoma platyrhinos]